MRIEILIGGRVHGMRDWSSVPAVGHDVWVKNVFQARHLETDRHRDGALKVVAVLWFDDRVQVNLETPEPGKFGLSN